MKAMKALLVGATACGAVATAPALVALPRRDVQPDSANSDATANLKVITLHGDRIAYRDEGAGEVLLLIHGMGGSSNSWSGVIPLLARQYRVIAPDLLGHGESDKPRGDYSVDAFAVLLRDLLDALDIHRVTVIGHSLGGGIAMQFAHQHRQYCKRIVLISSGGFGGDVSRALRLLSLPGSELVLPVIASRTAVLAGNALRALMGSSNRFHANPSLANPRQQAGIPAHTSRRCRLPRSGGLCLESPVLQCGSARTDHQR
jgi:pimeloyl-ACP methyl ester carboxylesterase